jgi:hypothetical protein
MTLEEFKERAENYRLLKEQAENEFSRFQLAALERSYRVLASSEEALIESEKMPARY